MENIKLKADRITSFINATYKNAIINGKKINLSNTLAYLEDRIDLRFKDVKTSQEAIELVKIWTSSEKLIKENWDVAFLLSSYQVEDTYRLQKKAAQYLEIDISDKEKLYQIVGLLNIRYANYEVRRRLLRYYRKAFGSRTFFRKDTLSLKIDNCYEEVMVRDYFYQLRNDLMNLEDKYRVAIAHAKNDLKKERAWKKYGKYLSLTFFILLLTDDIDKKEYRMISILSNLSGISYDNDFINKLRESVLEAGREINRYTIFYKVVIKSLSLKQSIKNQVISEAIKKGTQWRTEYVSKYREYSKLTNKEAKEQECLIIFFPVKIVEYLQLSELDAKRYELTVLYKAALNRESSNTTKNRRIDGIKKRIDYLSSVKSKTKNEGEKLHKKIISANEKGEKLTISKLSAINKISRETVYKKLYAYYYRCYAREKRKNSNWDENELLTYVSELYNIDNELLLKSIVKNDEKCQ
ncbi:hypothetical protein [Enterococcus plantarum]|uniref:hypothetical protein n=1 Tax=Enterococcus plantarum TaxID=1077675 RepID=UPI001A90C4EB|nr:hypothetical protein [Enterococcus plantarum]MBO0421456.1 hypothetical protein [Enterococcus plantarum]